MTYNSYAGEITLFGGAYTPAGWAYCDGSKLPFATYGELASVITGIRDDSRPGTFQLPLMPDVEVVTPGGTQSLKYIICVNGMDPGRQ